MGTNPPHRPPTSPCPSGLAFSLGLAGPRAARLRRRDGEKTQASQTPYGPAAGDAWPLVWGGTPAFVIPRGGALSCKYGQLRLGPISAFLCGPYVPHSDPSSSSCSPCISSFIYLSLITHSKQQNLPIEGSGRALPALLSKLTVRPLRPESSPWATLMVWKGNMMNRKITTQLKQQW